MCVTHFLKDGQVSKHPKTVSVMILGCLMYIPLRLLDQEEESYIITSHTEMCTGYCVREKVDIVWEITEPLMEEVVGTA